MFAWITRTGRRARPWLALPGLLGITLGALAASPEAALDIDTAARLALERQPQLLAREAMISALRADAVAARQLPDPRLLFGVEGAPVDSLSLTDEEMTQTRIGLSQMIPGGRKRQLSGERIEQAATLAGMEREASRREIARAARLAWLDAYEAETSATLAAEIEADYARQVEWARVAYTAGSVRQAEAYSLRARLARAGNDLAEWHGRRQRARARLARWIGDAAARPLEALADGEAPAALVELESRLAAHPALLSAEQSVAAARVEAEMARQAYKPDWSVDLVYGVRGNDRADLLTLMLGLDLPVFTAKRQDPRLAARLAEIEQAQALREDRRRELLAELRAAHADWQTADARLGRLDREILPLAERQVESALAGYASNQAGYDRVLEARRGVTETRLGRLALALERARAAVRLQYFHD